MLLTIDEVLAERTELEIPIGEKKLEFAFCPHAYTEPLSERIAGQSLNEVLPELLVSWNLADAEGNPLPITEEVLRERVSVPLKRAIFTKIGEALAPN